MHGYMILSVFMHIHSVSMQTQTQTTKAYIPLGRKTIRVGYWRWLGPQTPHFCVTYTNILVSFRLGDTNFLRPLTQNPQRESVEYRLRWVPNANFLHWPCTFHILCVDFIRVG